MTFSRPPRTLGPYVLGPKIGSGGMAGVFAARHQSSSGATRLIALKVMSTALASEDEFRDLFLREARVASRIEHANVVRVYDSGEIQGELFLAMELVEGASLSRLIAAKLPIGVALRIVIDLLRALHFAHEQRAPDGVPLGLIHQDVSPHNVLVAYDGTTKLLDFGVARLAVRERSRTDNVRGKPGYLAPEQILLGRLDRRVDIFAAGVVAHELLTASRLFVADTVATMHARILGDKIPRLDRVREDIAPGIADAVERALRREPEERWATAEDFRRALRDAAAAADIGIADDDRVGDSVRSLAPPTWSRASIERALAESTDVADLPTLAPRTRPAEEATADAGTVTATTRGAERRRPNLALVVAAVLLTTLGWFAARRFAPQPPTTASAEPSGAAPQSAPSAPATSALPEPPPASAAPPPIPASASTSAPPRAIPTHHAPSAPTPTASAPPSVTAPAASTAAPHDDPFGHQ